MGPKVITVSLRALNLAHEGKDTVLVTKDVPLRVKAGAVGLPRG